MMLASLEKDRGFQHSRLGRMTKVYYVKTSQNTRTTNRKIFGLTDRANAMSLISQRIETPSGCLEDAEAIESVIAEFKAKWPQRADVLNLSNNIYKTYDGHRLSFVGTSEDAFLSSSRSKKATPTPEQYKKKEEKRIFDEQKEADRISGERHRAELEAVARQRDLDCQHKVHECLNLMQEPEILHVLEARIFTTQQYENAYSIYERLKQMLHSLLEYMKESKDAASLVVRITNEMRRLVGMCEDAEWVSNEHAEEFSKLDELKPAKLTLQAKKEKVANEHLFGRNKNTSIPVSKHAHERRVRRANAVIHKKVVAISKSLDELAASAKKDDLVVLRTDNESHNSDISTLDHEIYELSCQLVSKLKIRKSKLPFNDTSTSVYLSFQTNPDGSETLLSANNTNIDPLLTCIFDAKYRIEKHVPTITSHQTLKDIAILKQRGNYNVHQRPSKSSVNNEESRMRISDSTQPLSLLSSFVHSSSISTCRLNNTVNENSDNNTMDTDT